MIRWMGYNNNKKKRILFSGLLLLFVSAAVFATQKTFAIDGFTIGMQFPDFDIPDHNNTINESKTYRGKYTLIDFWATWCAPCRKEIPNLVRAYRDYHDKGLNIVTISIDDKANKQVWLETLKENQMENFTNLFNPRDFSGLTRALKIKTIPANYLLDSTGKIIAINLRGKKLNEKLKELNN